MNLDINFNKEFPIRPFALEDVIQAKPYYDHLYETEAPNLTQIFQKMKQEGKKVSSPNDPIVQKRFKAAEERSQNEYQKNILKKFNLIQKLYENALSAGHFEGQELESARMMVLGSDFLRDKRLAKNELHNFKILSSHDNNKGAILNEQTFWNLLANDAVVLGVIQGHKEVWVSTLKPTLKTDSVVSMEDSEGKPTIHDDVLWDSENNRLRVLGREISQLRAAGYELDPTVPRDFGFCLRCPRDKMMAASQMTLNQLCEAAEKTTLEEIKNFLHL